MTGKREFFDYLADIQEASQNISRFISDMTWSQFARDQKTYVCRSPGIRDYRRSGQVDPTHRQETTSEGSLEIDGRNAGQTHP